MSPWPHHFGLLGKLIGACSLNLTLVLATLCALCLPASAQEAFPSKPILLVVPFAGGSGSDTNARVFSKEAGAFLNQVVLVENRPGANGAIGSQLVAKAKPDGYTLLMGSATTNAANYAFFPGKLGYDKNSFDIVAPLGSVPIVLWVATNSPFKDLRSLVDFAKKNPGKLTCGNGNAVTQVACEVFKKQAGIFAVSVNYRANAQALNDLSGNQLDFAFSDPAGALGSTSTNRVRPLAVASKERMSNFKDAPTFAESGYQDMEITAWSAVYVPKGTPREVLDKLNAAVRKMGDSETSLKLRQATGSLKMDMNVDEARRFSDLEIARWERYIRLSGVKADAP